MMTTGLLSCVKNGVVQSNMRCGVEHGRRVLEALYAYQSAGLGTAASLRRHHNNYS